MYANIESREEYEKAFINRVFQWILCAAKLIEKYESAWLAVLDTKNHYGYPQEEVSLSNRTKHLKRLRRRWVKKYIASRQYDVRGCPSGHRFVVACTRNTSALRWLLENAMGALGPTINLEALLSIAAWSSEFWFSLQLKHAPHFLEEGNGRDGGPDFLSLSTASNPGGQTPVRGTGDMSFAKLLDSTFPTSEHPGLNRDVT
ncbi:hypothetical protein MKZ38_001179 [Zalerion maritima]|uniref:Uncharacterized protein n=1 Tax=Zalerion maritima TaxID=339359 RepID=A0AAD5RXP1_9PEZI|nr:hypothetical protein MKZ38_001179 [Zalerion maritima]